MIGSLENAVLVEGLVGDHRHLGPRSGPVTLGRPFKAGSLVRIFHVVASRRLTPPPPRIEFLALESIPSHPLEVFLTAGIGADSPIV